MKRAAFALLGLLLSAPSVAAASPDDSITRINAAPARDGWFVCDALSSPYALFAGKADKGASVITLLDRRTGRFDTQSYQVGNPDPGAGQIYWSLSQGGKEVGNVHAVNPGMIEDDGATVPTVTSVKLDDRQLDCRFLAHTRFIGLDSRRTVVVTETPQGLVYQAFSFRKRGPAIQPDGVQRTSKPTLKLLGGSEVVGDRPGFRFANAGYVYYVQRPRGGEAAGLTVTHNGILLGAEKYVGFTYAPPIGRAPEKLTAALGPDSVWSGQGVDTCRKGDAKLIDACLVDLMRKGGASAASIAFTQKLIAADSPGYVSGWRQAGRVGIATVTYPFRANTNSGTWLAPVAGDPIDADAYQLTAGDKLRADYKAAMADNPNAFPVPPGTISFDKTPAGNLRVLVTTPTATCRACAPGASIIVGYDFDAAGHFLFAGVVAVA
ncbi:hypothetical protein HZF05_15275 [Sphingomonas sp. CGMCC 1.13654]|uniref:Uncharacterized protein n=1 Tax=Sphingomonas chungangi TaxID=2683589 RepID=A0A838L8U3_9SPHN|nr:hypothetical protein [Sphingomonas chungangi]MBA2935447.1 hypothetical protein [Sphingomonas chungangi]MVW56954.1 hypothetical protein [Sphingomonas chungangi]